jgi:hypothetical protein
MKQTIEQRREKCRAYYIAHRDKIREWNAEYYKANKENRNAKNKEWKAKNPERTRELLRRYVSKNGPKIKEYMAAWRAENKDKMKAHSLADYHKKYRSDILFRLRRRARAHVARIKTGHLKSPIRSMEYIGCTVEEFKAHIESLWVDGMTWENNTKHGWHIDHIRPLASFDLTNPEQMKCALHYTNLQPLWARDNLEKHAKYYE